ncbi:CocE/NonD family hydrolase C-terminal non-catalytic domain-containing protein [Streptomyces sp. NPDC056468]|uniref:CocE/NonD family hydrolase C-terminal non-catalytic domain-containing protein n=1 Tax=Streptomyces sp. NPDC056468 TaxID=3345830 RepID=UPI0036978989
MTEPLLCSYVSDSHRPATVYPTLPGRWVGEPAWPSPHVRAVTYALQAAPVLVRSPMHTGIDASRFFPFGNEDARSACFEFEVGEETWVLGRPKVRLRLTSEVPRGQVVARLCDVAPDGSSTLVTRGVLNLSARHGRDRTVPWEPGATEDVTFELNGIGHAFPPGHRIRPATASTYRLLRVLAVDLAPARLGGGLRTGTVGKLAGTSGTRTCVGRIDGRHGDHLRGTGAGGAARREHPHHAGRTSPRAPRRAGRGQGRVAPGGRPRYGGTRVYPDGLEFTEDALETYTINEWDPLSARTRSD